MIDQPLLSPPNRADGPASDRVVVSVLMPVLNAQPYLAAAIESILAQDYQAFELVVVDDGSTDGSREYLIACNDARIVLIDGPRAGIAACMNTALQRAQGQLVMRCDADDLYPPGRIRRQVEWLNARPDYVAVCGAFSAMGSSGAVVASPLLQSTRELPDAQERILDGRLRTHLCTFAIRRAATRQLGGFRVWFETAEDIDFMLRLANVGPIGFLPETAYAYRLHDRSITHTQASKRRRFFEECAYGMSVERSSTGDDSLARGRPPEPPQLGALDGHPHDAGRHLSQLLVGEAWLAFRDGDRTTARRRAWQAVCASLTYADAWKSMLLISVRCIPERTSR
jgi:glycosyltransferase involved in cell wall biosynthesis